MSPTDVVLRFNSAINARDLEALAQLMTDDHCFIDSAGTRVQGKRACVEAWRGFFAAFPDYRNEFEQLEERDGVVTVHGRSHCSVAALAGRACWTARVRGDQVAEWRVHEV